MGSQPPGRRLGGEGILTRVIAPTRSVGLVLASLAALACEAESPSALTPTSPASTSPPSRAPSPSAPSASAPSPSAPPTRATVVEYATAPSRHGYLYRPSGAGPFPVVVYNHGSEARPSDFGGQARFFVRRGHVLLVPHRRGHGLSSDVTAYRSDVLANRDAAPGALVRVLEEELADVEAAVRYARALPDVDRARVYVIGCSLGGVESLLMAERGDGVRAVVDFAGGSITWARDAALRTRMTRAARAARVPVLFIQAENDFDTTPSRALAQAMHEAGRPAQLRLFPPSGRGPHDGHAFCAGGDAPAWGDAVLGFLASPGALIAPPG